MTPKTLHRLAMASLSALIALLMAWVIWLAPPPASLKAPLLLILVGPLALALRGVLHARRYTLAWSTLLILFYFAHGVAYAVGGGVSQALGVVEIALTLIYFGSTTRFMRRTRPGRPVAPEPGG